MLVTGFSKSVAVHSRIRLPVKAQHHLVVPFSFSFMNILAYPCIQNIPFILSTATQFTIYHFIQSFPTILSLYIVKATTNMMTNAASWKPLVLMAFPAYRNLVLSANLFKKYPYWADYLTDPHALRLNRYLTSPTEVLPGRLFENYTKLTVSNLSRGYE